MEQVYRIRNMRKFEGKSLRKIFQLTGHDFETVKKYVEKDDFNLTIRPKQKRNGKLSPYRSIVTTWLTKDKQAPHKQQHTARRVYDRLKELYGDEFDASERAIRKFVADIRKELQTNTDGFLPLEHPPGEAQADFGEVQFIENGITYDGYYLNMSYPHSNGGHTQLFKSANQDFQRIAAMNSDILIKQYCKELRIGMNIYENYSKISATNYADFLAWLLKVEIDHRELKVILQVKSTNHFQLNHRNFK